MDWKAIREELSRLTTLVDGWCDGRVTTLERDLALEKLRMIYETIRFAEVAAAPVPHGFGAEVPAVPAAVSAAVAEPEPAPEKPASDEPVATETHPEPAEKPAAQAAASEAPVESAEPAPAAPAEPETAPQATLFNPEEDEAMRHRRKQRVILSLYGAEPEESVVEAGEEQHAGVLSESAVSEPELHPERPVILERVAAEPVAANASVTFEEIEVETIEVVQPAPAPAPQEAAPERAAETTEIVEEEPAVDSESESELEPEPESVAGEEEQAAAATEADDRPEPFFRLTVDLPADSEKDSTQVFSEELLEARDEVETESSADEANAEAFVPELLIETLQPLAEERPATLSSQAPVSLPDPEPVSFAEKEPEQESFFADDAPASEFAINLRIDPEEESQPEGEEASAEAEDTQIGPFDSDLAEEATTAPQPVLGDKIFPHVQTLADTLEPQVDVASALRHGAISDLRQAIGINDKFRFIRDLFDGDMEAYESTMQQLNSFDNLDDCMIYIAENHAWNPNAESVQLLMELLERKFVE